MPPGEIFCTTVFYSSLPLIWHAKCLCLYKMDFGPFVATTPCFVPRGYIKSPNVFLLSSSTGLLSETVSRFQLKKPKRKSYFLTSTDPRHAPGATFLHHYILLSITFDLICNMTMFVQNGFWTLRGHTPWPCPLGLHQNSECVPPVLIHRAIACESFEILAKMV